VIPSDIAWVPPVPAAAGDIAWSSKVYYYQKINNWISWFYKENKEIFGVRYYTESLDTAGNGKPKRSSLAYEHTLSRTVPAWSDDSWFSDYLDWIFTDNDEENLSETVIRYEIGTNGQKTVKSSTKVVPTFGETFTIDNQMDYTFE
ncbi:hypothetical protein, partial [Oceanispirochaeta sp.]|uniref:hypothetical protein n=1 Tax=Oceanispirochaeta sp. TaxID=2035350 RepID=UPI00262796B9